jgi:hypothetical protein
VILATPDPNLFHIDWEQTSEVLMCIVVLAFFVERALALVFESQIYIKTLGKFNLKELIALATCFLVTWMWNLDAPSIILHGEKITFIGRLITAAVIAGGSKASLKLFRDVMGIENEQAKVDRAQKVTSASVAAAAARES